MPSSRATSPWTANIRTLVFRAMAFVAAASTLHGPAAHAILISADSPPDMSKRKSQPDDNGSRPDGASGSTPNGARPTCHATDANDANDATDLLPSDGGDPARAYRAYLAVLQSGDVIGLTRLVTLQRLDEIQALRQDKDFKPKFGFMQARSLRQARFVHGTLEGRRATLEFSGKDAAGNPATSRVTLVHDGDRWLIATEWTSTSIH